MRKPDFDRITRGESRAILGISLLTYIPEIAEALEAPQEIQVLQSFVVPLSETMSGRARFPVNWGPEAEVLLLRKNANSDMLWQILQAHSHINTLEAFCHELHKAFGNKA